ncbi:tail fiber protein [Dickeya oryzae]
MKPLIPVTTQSSDGVFYDENQITGAEGTIVDAAFMNNVQGAVRSVQSEIVSILATAGMQPDQASVNQLLTALDGRFAKVASPALVSAGSALTLTIDYSGKVLIARAGSTVTLPASATITAGRAFTVLCADASCTVQLSGTDNCTGLISGLTFPLTMSSGETITLVSRGSSNAWAVSSYTTRSLSNASLSGVPTAPTAGAGTNTNQVATTAFVQSEISALTGIPLPWPQATAPAGWLKCNGQAFDKAVYPRLAQVYPSGVLPDLRGEFIRGWDDGRGVDAGRGVLSGQSDAIRNIAGKFSILADGSVSPIRLMTPHTTTGAFYVDGDKTETVRDGYVVNSNANYGGNFAFDASRVVPTASENRPRNIAFNYIVRAA